MRAQFDEETESSCIEEVTEYILVLNNRRPNRIELAPTKLISPQEKVD